MKSLGVEPELATRLRQGVGKLAVISVAVEKRPHLEFTTRTSRLLPVQSPVTPQLQVYLVLIAIIISGLDYAVSRNPTSREYCCRR